MPLPRMTRRRFANLAAAGLLGGGGYLGYRAVRSVRDAARRSADT